MHKVALVVIMAILFVNVVVAEEAENVNRYEVSVSSEEMAEGFDGVATVLKKHLDGPLQVYYEAKVYQVQTASTIGISVSIILLLIVAIWSMFYGACQDFDGKMVVSLLTFFFLLIGAVSMYYYLTADYQAMREIVDMASQFTP